MEKAKIASKIELEKQLSEQWWIPPYILPYTHQWNMNQRALLYIVLYAQHAVTSRFTDMMRSSLAVRASGCQCTSCNGPGFDPSIRRHSGIWGAADETVLNKVWKKWKKSPQKIKNKKIYRHEINNKNITHRWLWGFKQFSSQVSVCYCVQAIDQTSMKTPNPKCRLLL